MNDSLQFEGCSARRYAGQLTASLAAGLRFYGGGSSSSNANPTTTTISKPVTGTDQAIIMAPDNGSGLNAGQIASGQDANTGLVVKDGSAINITDGGIVRDALDLINSALSQFNQADAAKLQELANLANNTANQATVAQSDSSALLKNLIAQNADLAKTASSASPQTTQLALLALAAVAAVIAFKKKP